MGFFFGGLDLGKSQDYSALVVAEQALLPEPDEAGRPLYRYDVRWLHRWELGTSYGAVVSDLRGWYEQSPLANSTLVIDGTGVGAAVVDMVREAGLSAHVEAYTITAGHKPGDGTVPKKDLVAAALTLAQGRRVNVAPELPFAGVLARELETFRTKVTPERHETFSAWRETDKDDLVLGLCLLLWYAEQHPGDPGGCYASSGPTNPFSRLPPGTFSNRPPVFADPRQWRGW